MKKVLFLLAIIFSGFSANFVAAEDSETEPDTVADVILYEGKLFGPGGTRITTPHVIRFSMWASSDFIPSDLNDDGTINSLAPNYGGWFEEHTFIPNIYGSFSVKIGSKTSLPEMNFQLQKFMQIEIRAAANPLTAYELMDPTGDRGGDYVDRQAIGAVPYARNSAKLQDRRIGILEGDLALLSENGKWRKNQIPDGTDEKHFILDAENSVQSAGAGEIKLQFGESLDRYLTFDLENEIFKFNDDVEIAGNLKVSGEIVGGKIDAEKISLENIGWESLKSRGKKLQFSPEFSEVMIFSRDENNAGTIRLQRQSGHNFYEFSTAKNELQNLSLAKKIQLPSDFESFAENSLEIFARTGSANLTNNFLRVEISDTAGNLVATEDFKTNSGAWSSFTFENLTGSFAAGEVFEIVFTFAARGEFTANLGGIAINFIGK